MFVINFFRKIGETAMVKNTFSQQENTRHNSTSALDILQHLKEGIAVLRDGRIEYANPAFMNIIGHPGDGLMGRELSELFPAGERDALRRNHDAVHRNAETSTAHEFWIETGRGELCIEMTMTMLHSEDPAAVLITVVDVTPRRSRIEEIRKLGDRLQSILHSMHDVVVSLSVEDATILSINPAAEVLFGIPLRNLTQGAADDLIALAHPADRDRVGEFYRSIIGNKFDELEYRIVRSDGTLRWVRDEGYVAYCKSRGLQRIDHMIRDITEEKQAILDLHRSEQRYKEFFHKTKDMAFSVSPLGVFLDINDAGIELLGLSGRKAALRSNVYDFAALPADLDAMLSELNEKGHVSNRSVTLKPASGMTIEVDVTARVKKNETGEVLYYEGIASNITQALENQRNRVLRNTAAGMCHYLNSHLMHISSALDGMEEELSEMDEQFMTSSGPQRKDEIWFSGRNSLKGYVREVNLGYRKISEITRAFNSAFLTYREETYLDKTILDIFSACRPAIGGGPRSDLET